MQNPSFSDLLSSKSNNVYALQTSLYAMVFQILISLSFQCLEANQKKLLTETTNNLAP